jgi:hypothetical protein
MRKNNKKQRKQQTRNKSGKIRSLEYRSDTLVRRMSTTRLVSTTAGSIVAVTTDIQSDFCFSFPSTEWASYAARFGQYRTIAMTVTFFPCDTTPPGGVNTSASMFIVSDFIVTTVPTTVSGLIADRSSKCVSTTRQFKYKSTWNRFPNARLWTPTSTAIPAANRYGIAYATYSNATVLTPAAPLYVVLIEHEVEFSESG